MEADAQPEAFGSIPRAMWWSIVTLTTIGYGDIYPVTVLGKVFAAVTAVIGIGLIASRPAFWRRRSATPCNDGGTAANSSAPTAPGISIRQGPRRS